MMLQNKIGIVIVPCYMKLSSFFAILHTAAQKDESDKLISPWKNIINFRKICRRHLSVTAILQLRI